MLVSAQGAYQFFSETVPAESLRVFLWACHELVCQRVHLLHLKLET